MHLKKHTRNDRKQSLWRQLPKTFRARFPFWVIAFVASWPSRKYMPLYVAEFQFRYNNRFNEDIFGAAIAGC